MSDPTRIDAGRSRHDLKIEIIVNPLTQNVSITDNLQGDLTLFAYIVGQALQTYAKHHMAQRASTVGTRSPSPPNGGSS